MTAFAHPVSTKIVGETRAHTIRDTAATVATAVTRDVAFCTPVACDTFVAVLSRPLTNFTDLAHAISRGAARWAVQPECSSAQCLGALLLTHRAVETLVAVANCRNRSIQYASTVVTADSFIKRLAWALQGTASTNVAVCAGTAVASGHTARGGARLKAAGPSPSNIARLTGGSCKMTFVIIVLAKTLLTIDTLSSVVARGSRTTRALDGARCSTVAVLAGTRSCSWAACSMAAA